MALPDEVKRIRERYETSTIFNQSDIILRAHDKGLSARQINKKYQISPEVTRYFINLRTMMSKELSIKKKFDILEKAFPKVETLFPLIIAEDYLQSGNLGELIKKFDKDPRYLRGLLRILDIYNNLLPYVGSKIVRSYGRTRSLSVSSNLLGYSEGLIKKTLKERGIKIKSASRLKTERIKRDKADIIRDYQSGLTTEQLSEIYNANPTTIEKYLRMWGVKLRGFPKRLGGIENIRKLVLEQGLSDKEIAKLYGVDFNAVIRLRVRAGIRKVKKGFKVLSSQENLERIGQLYNKNYSISLIAERLDSTPTVIRARLKRISNLKERDRSNLITKATLQARERAKKLEKKTFFREIKTKQGDQRRVSPSNNPTIVNLVRELRKKKVPIPEVARRTKLTEGQVLYIIKLHNIPPARNVFFTPEVIQKVVSMYNSGQSPNNIARRLGAEPDTVRYFLRKEGVDLTKSKFARRYTQEEIKRQNKIIEEMTLKGIGSRPIADRLGLDKSTVLDRREKLGLGKYRGVSRTTYPEAYWKKLVRKAGYFFYIRGKSKKWISQKLDVGARTTQRLLDDVDLYYKYKVDYYIEGREGFEKKTIDKTFSKIREAQKWMGFVPSDNIRTLPPRLILIKKEPKDAAKEQ